MYEASRASPVNAVRVTMVIPVSMRIDPRSRFRVGFTKCTVDSFSFLSSVLLGNNELRTAPQVDALLENQAGKGQDCVTSLNPHGIPWGVSRRPRGGHRDRAAIEPYGPTAHNSRYIACRRL